MATSDDTSNNPGPLAGIRILDLSRILAGPFCTQLMGDYGADVIKVERPGQGDDTRAWGPPYVMDRDSEPTNESAYYLATNRNKRSIAIDVATSEGAATVKRLVRHCDVLIENFKVGGLKKYGLDYASLADDHPSLIYCSISGFGQTGPNAHRPGYDLLAQAFGGIMSLTGEPGGEPIKVGVGIADVVCGLYASTAILAAIRHRDQNGEGQHLDIGLADTQISWLINEGTNYLLSGNPPIRRGNQHPNIVPYQVFETSDGHVVIAVGNDSQFRRLCDLLNEKVLLKDTSADRTPGDVTSLADDARFSTNAKRVENRNELVEILQVLIGYWTKLDLVTGMDTNGIPGGGINTVPEVFASAQVKARDMKISVPHSRSATGQVNLIGNPVKFSKTPVTYRYGPPLCGEHTDEILAEFFTEQHEWTDHQ